MPALVKMTVRFPYVNATFSRDEAINDFWFYGSGTPEDQASYWEPKLEAFYNDVPSSGATALYAYMSKVLDGPHAEIIAYEVNVATGLSGPPLGTVAWTLTDRAEADLPLEVALVASVRSTLAPATGGALLPLQRRTGRIYLGPLNQNAVGSDTTSGYPLPSTQFRTDLSRACYDLSTGDMDQSDWVIYSRAARACSAITNGWVDNAWDTQRRRGTDPTSRTSWATV